MADISKVGIISVEGRKIVDRINAVEPLTSASAIVDATYNSEYSDNELNGLSWSQQFTAIETVFMNKLNEIKAKLRTAGLMGE